MLTGNKLGTWLLPFKWEKRRDKELAEVMTIYKELQRREDIVNQYNIKESILKGDASLRDLNEYLEKRKLKNFAQFIVAKETQEETEEDRKLPHVNTEIKQIVIEKPQFTSHRFRGISMDDTKEKDRSVDSDGIPIFIKDIISPKVGCKSYF
jgi:hypothetical protein